MSSMTELRSRGTRTRIREPVDSDPSHLRAESTRSQSSADVAAPAASGTAGMTSAARAEYASMNAAVLPDTERWPTVTASGLAALAALREEPMAPAWTHACGDRLTRNDQALLAVLAADVRRGAYAQTSLTGPRSWVDALAMHAVETVPFYRRLRRNGDIGAHPALSDLPVLDRRDLRELGDLVPMDAELDRILEGTSSGSTGASLRIPLHPRGLASDIVILRWWLERLGLHWDVDETGERLALANIVDQASAFTYASLLTAHAERALMARVNLHPDAWHQKNHQHDWWAHHDPLVLSGSPLPLLNLACREPGLSPVAVVSGASHLTDTARSELADTWKAPVLDVYALGETEIVACDPDGCGHRVAPLPVHVEILDEHGLAVAPGERGRIVITSATNPLLPLLRYDTGDTGALELRAAPDAPGGAEAVIVGLEGRATVRYRHGDGTWIPSVSLVQVLQSQGAAVWSVHQWRHGALRAEVAPPHGPLTFQVTLAVRDALAALLGQDVTVVPLHDSPAAKRRFTSDVPGHAGPGT